MTRSELVAALAEKKNIPVTKADSVVSTIFDGMFDTLVLGGRIELRGFASFELREYGAYKGRVPKTGESIDVKPKRLPFFKVGVELKNRVNRT